MRVAAREVIRLGAARALASAPPSREVVELDGGVEKRLPLSLVRVVSRG